MNPIPCVECGRPLDIKKGDKIVTNLGCEMELASDDNKTCKLCLSQGWSVATPQDFKGDPDLQTVIPSPFS